MKRNRLVTELLGVAIEPTYFDLEHHRLDCAEVVSAIKGLGANAVRVGMFSHQGHAYYPSRIAPHAPFLNGSNLLAEFEQACRRAGLHLVVYLNSKWVTVLYRQHPDWIVRFASGPYVFPAEGASLAIHPMCPNSPFLEYFLGIVHEVVTLSRPSAIYIDNFGLEPFCRCRFCRQAFGAAIPHPCAWRAPRTQRYLDRLVTHAHRIARRIVAVARATDARLPVIFNGVRFWSEAKYHSPEENAVYGSRLGDAIHVESAVRLFGHSFEHINEQCALGRSLGVPVWTWVEYPMLPFSYVPPTPAEVRIKAAKVVANGGRPMVWSLPCAPSINLIGAPGLRDVFSLVAAHPPLFKGVSFERFAAVLFSSRSVRAHCRGQPARLTECKQSFAGALELLIRTHWPYDYVLDEQVTLDTLRQYRVLILPNVIYLDRHQCEQIRRYVREGGALFATHATSLCDPFGNRRRAFALQDVLGVRYTRPLGKQYEGYSAGYARFAADHPLDPVPGQLFPVGGNYLAVASSDAIAYLLQRCRYYCDYPQPRTAYPAIVARRYGHGKVVYIPGEFFSFYHDKGLLEYARFFQRSLEWFAGGKPPLITDLPDTVEITITRARNGCRVVHLINCTFDKTRPIQEITPVTGKQLMLSSRGTRLEVRDLASGRKLRATRVGHYLKINLPDLTGYNVLVVR